MKILLGELYSRFFIDEVNLLSEAQVPAWLEDLCLRGLVTQGLVRRMLGYARECRDFTQGGDIRKGLYLSHLAYDMARNGKDLPPHEVQRLTCLGQDKDLFPKAELGITWALYRTRISG